MVVFELADEEAQALVYRLHLVSEFFFQRGGNRVAGGLSVAHPEDEAPEGIQADSEVLALEKREEPFLKKWVLEFRPEDDKQAVLRLLPGKEAEGPEFEQVYFLRFFQWFQFDRTHSPAPAAPAFCILSPVFSIYFCRKIWAKTLASPRMLEILQHSLGWWAVSSVLDQTTAGTPTRRM